MQPSIAVITPTINRLSLRECHASVAPQLGPNDTHLIVTDGIPITELPYMPKAFCVEGPKTNRWGNRQRDLGISLARTTHLWFLDDDDLALDGALDAIRSCIEQFSDRLILARFQPHHAGVSWGEPVLRSGNVGTPCCIVPKDKAGWWDSDRYDADFPFIQECARLCGEPIWMDRVVCVARRIETPKERLEMAAAKDFQCVAPAANDWCGSRMNPQNPGNLL